MDDGTFKYALVVSVILHAVVLVRLSYSNTHYFHKPIKSLEVSYHKIKDEVKKVTPPSKNLKDIKERKLPPNTKELIRKKPQSFQTALVKDMPKLVGKLKIHRKQPSKVPDLYGKKEISVPVLKSEKITNPKYLNYHQSIRQKIKERAYLYVNNPEFEIGEVYLTFVLQSDGTLKQIKIIEDKTMANDYLRKASIRSIKESSPFAPFPQDLTYPELSFHVVISFEIKE